MKPCLDCPTLVQDHRKRCRPCFLKLPGEPIQKAFAKFVVQTETCWLWSGGTGGGGYGAFHPPKTRKMIPAHRQSWINNYGEIPKGMIVMHTCDVRHCVRPDHLFLGTMQRNTDDMTLKRRGNFFGHSQKLTPDDVRRIRKVYKKGTYTLKMLAKEYHCHLGTIYDAIHRRWKHV